VTCDSKRIPSWSGSRACNALNVTMRRISRCGTIRRGRPGFWRSSRRRDAVPVVAQRLGRGARGKWRAGKRRRRAAVGSWSRPPLAIAQCNTPRPRALPPPRRHETSAPPVFELRATRLSASARTPSGHVDLDPVQLQ
jgi:hypothetical protein